eukprot:3249-Prymnesium_polylepis.1
MATRPTGHDVCPFCQSIQSRQDALQDLCTSRQTTPKQSARLTAEVVEHKQFNDTERGFYTRACTPRNTTLNV